jgi:hypothetical protein
MMHGDRLITAAAVCLCVALAAMLLAVIRPTPLTIGMFLGLGPIASGTGFVLFACVVVRDLRQRRAL